MSDRLFAVPYRVDGNDVKTTRKRLGLKQREFADLVDVSVKTVERWESGKTEVKGPIVFLMRILNENPDIVNDARIPEKPWKLRLWYMCRGEVCTIIDVNERDRLVRINNYTSKLQFRAFGGIEKPTYRDYEEFLESRCFPNGRDKMKVILNELNIPFYDPLLIIEKTKGRMAEDDFWIKVER